MSGNCDIEIGFDEVSKDYYIICDLPTAIGSSGTEIEALHDLRDAAHFGIDSIIEQKRKEMAKED